MIDQHDVADFWSTCSANPHKQIRLLVEIRVENVNANGDDFLDEQCFRSISHHTTAISFSSLPLSSSFPGSFSYDVFREDYGRFLAIELIV